MAVCNSLPELPYEPKLQYDQSISGLDNIYKPVGAGEFRVLNVEGRDSQGCLVVSLHCQPLQSPPPFAAISYTWNEQDRLWYGEYDARPKPIRINGELVLVSDKVANILSLALKHGRYILWIDTLCINQSDLSEKSRQVSHMGDIYSQATEVLAMIGSPSEATEIVLDSANDFAKDPSQKFAPAVLAKLLKFINGGYWTRAWILQELTMAKSILVCCGTRTADLRSIAELGRHLENIFQSTESLSEMAEYGSYLVTAFSGHLKQRVLYSGADLASLGHGRRETLIDVLENSRQYWACADPRDMLYSRLALASDANALIPYPDYTIGVEELYKRFATNCILLTKSLKVITFANSTTMNLPTWVPDWSFKQRRWDVTGEFAELSEEITQLCWDEKGLPRVSQCRTELMVQGRIIGAVSKRDWLETIASGTISFSKFSQAYHQSDIPQKGDLVCVLRSCPLLVHLRSVEDHFIVVGRHAIGRTYGAKEGLKVDTIGKAVYSFASFEDTQRLPERLFKIR
ncbi:heterokaryon incompatibility protein-domain-containing protein [Xylaria flabelliformis]|nr:heterokaryon incompatibility protein-domain-containing protein [Xylaria flabelliformis]